MRCKFRITGPICLVIVLVMLLGYFCLTSLAVGDSTSAQSEDVVSVTVETLAAENVNAPARVEETMVPQETVTEADENPDAREDDGDVSDDEVLLTDGSGYELTESERIAVECAVMCEAGGEGTEGQMMVAQSILDGSLRNGFNVFQTIYTYQIHSTAYSNVTDEVRESVSRVFDEGQRITEEKTDLWYNPALVESQWHEEQQYIITVGSHRFFWMNSDMES